MLGVFGKFTLLDKIAEGGMAEVFRASVRDQAGYDRIVAIKRLHRSLCDDSEITDMLADEARLTVQLDHPNIGRVFDLGVYDKQSFLIMEFIDGPDLQFLQERFALNGQNFPLFEALYTMSQTLGALHYAHTRTSAKGAEMNIVHRDVSPQNIMIDVHGEVRIVDFGIAKAKDRLVQTQHGIIKGKYFYMSPEQAMGHHVDGRSDVFSVGMVLYELLAGRSPYQDYPDVKLLKAVRRADFPDLNFYRPDIDSEIVNIIARSTTRDPARRFSSALEFKYAIDAALQRLSGSRLPDLAGMVRNFFSPSLDQKNLMKPGSYRTSAESVIFHLSNSEIIRLRPPAANKPPALAPRRPVIVQDFQNNPAGIQSEPSALAPVQSTESRMKLGKSQTRIIVALLGIAGLLVVVSFAVLYMKRDKPDVPVATELGVEELAVKDAPPEKQPVAIVSTPSNALVLVDGKESGTTPLSVSLVAGQTYKIVLRKEGYAEVEKDLLVQGDSLEVNEKLEETRRIVSLMSYPSGARIEVKGKEKGKTPVSVANLPEKEDITIVAILGSKTQEKTIQWKEGDPSIKELMFEFKTAKSRPISEISLIPMENNESPEKGGIWGESKPSASRATKKADVRKPRLPRAKVAKKKTKAPVKKVAKKTPRKKASSEEELDVWGDSPKKSKPKKVKKVKKKVKKKKKAADDDW